MAQQQLNVALIEVLGLAPALVIADEAIKAAEVRIVDVEGNTGQDCMIKLLGDAANCRRAIEVAERIANLMGAKFAATLKLNFGEDDRVPMIFCPQEYSPITQGYLHLLPREGAIGDAAMQAIGLLETQGLTAVLEGADAMLKAADVEIAGKEKIGAAHVTVMVRGDVAAVKAAIEAGREAASRVGKVVAAHVIARPHDGLARLLPE